MAVFQSDKPTTGPTVEWHAVRAGTATTGHERGVQLVVLIQPEPLYGDVARHVQELAHLRRGWDGHDALPPRPEAIREALAFLTDLETVYRGLIPVPMVGPAPDGGVVFVWRRANSEAEITFLEPGMAEFALSDRDGFRPVEVRDHLGRHDLVAIAQSYLIT
ncbi:MAG: hypothetical protein ACREMB_22980 [Candidatus Rokuibacteriota bacterium]